MSKNLTISRESNKTGSRVWLVLRDENGSELARAGGARARTCDYVVVSRWHRDDKWHLDLRSDPTYAKNLYKRYFFRGSITFVTILAVESPRTDDEIVAEAAPKLTASPSPELLEALVEEQSEAEAKVLTALIDNATELAECYARRNELLAAAHGRGLSLRRIAQAAGMSAFGVSVVLNRQGISTASTLATEVPR